MLGYVRAYKPELKCGEFDTYKGVYCTLCKTLLRRYSPLGQLFLSYDAAFFALCLLGKSAECPAERNGRCCYNPLKKCRSCGRSAQMDFCADVSILLYYYQISDHLRDKGFLKKLAALLLFPIIFPLYRLARRRQSAADSVIGGMMRRQAAAESDPACPTDAAASPSGEALRELAAMQDPDEAFGQFFYLLGRFVYLIDAADDARDDLRTGSFNPLKEIYRMSPDRFASRAMEMLNGTIAEMLHQFDRITWARYAPIIHNVVFDGLYNSALFVTKKYRMEKEAAA